MTAESADTGFEKWAETIRDPATKALPLETRSLANRSWAALVAEAKKCTLLCLNCHAEVEHDQVPCSAVELPALPEAEHSGRE